MIKVEIETRENKIVSSQIHHEEGCDFKEIITSLGLCIKELERKISEITASSGDFRKILPKAENILSNIETFQKIEHTETENTGPVFQES